MIRRISCLLLGVLSLVCFAIRPSSARAEDEDPTANLEVPNCIVVDQNDPTVVFYEKNADVQSVPGSTMKIMTCILSIELCQDLEQTVEVTGQAASLKETNSRMGVIRGEELTVRELLYGLMLESGNDAALLLANTFGGSMEGFVELMNAKAAELGMANTHFLNASGAYKSGQYSTARDLAILTCYAMKNELFRTIVSTVNYTIEPNDVRTREMEMTNSNKLISDPADSDLFYEYATGVKTGSTGVGGKCLVGSATMDGASVVAVMLGVTEGGSKLARMSQVYRDAKSIMDLTLTTRYVTVSPADLGITTEFSADVEGGEQTSVAVNAVFTPETVRLPDIVVEKIKADTSLITAETNITKLTAPVNEGDGCGTATYSYNGTVLFTAELAAGGAVQSPTAAPISTAVPSPTAEPTPVPSAGILANIPVWEWAMLGGVLVAVALIILLIVLNQKQKAKRRKKKRHTTRHETSSRYVR